MPQVTCTFRIHSDKWHVPRYATRTHCITTLSHGYIFGKFTENFGKVRRSPGFPKLQKSFIEEFVRLFEIFRKSSFFLENFTVRKSSENFGKLLKQFKTVFRNFYDFLKIFGTFSELFGSFRINSETVPRENCFAGVFNMIYFF